LGNLAPLIKTGGNNLSGNYQHESSTLAHCTDQEPLKYTTLPTKQYEEIVRQQNIPAILNRKSGKKNDKMRTESEKRKRNTT
jgi:hypothetical protein